MSSRKWGDVKSIKLSEVVVSGRETVYRVTLDFHFHPKLTIETSDYKHASLIYQKYVALKEGKN